MSGNSDIEEIKSKLDVVSVISDYLQLHKAGVNFKAPCPFHHEKTPSFMVNPERQRWHCFGCSEDGDIFTFVMKMEGVEFPEALKQLARKAGVTLKHDFVNDGSEGRRQRLFDVNRLAALYFHEVLLRSSQAERARAYVARRGLKQETLEDFMIGFSPDSWDSLLKILRQKGFKDDESFRAGLVSKSERGSGYFDRFRGRLMFPIRDAQKNYVGFTGRIMPGPDGQDPPKEAKYINTVQTEIYNKSGILFALDVAKQAIRRTGVAVIVEGNMDAISSHQAGIKNVIASSGTAFTIDQLALFKLKNLTNKLVLSFDMDPAGEQAARRSIDAAVAAGFEVRVLRLPPDAGKDPDDCIRKDPAIWQRAIDQAAPFMEWYINLAKGRVRSDDPHAKSKAAQDILGELAKISDPIERTYWVRYARKAVNDIFDTNDIDLQVKLNQILAQQAPAGAAAVPAGRRPAGQDGHRANDRHGLVSDYLVGFMANWPELAQAIIAEVRPEYLSDDDRPLYKAQILAYNEHRTDGGDNKAPRFSLGHSGDVKTAERIAILQLLAEKEFGEFPSDARSEALAKLVGEIKRLHTTRRQRELIAAMSDAEKAGDAASISEIQRQLNELIL